MSLYKHVGSTWTGKTRTLCKKICENRIQTDVHGDKETIHWWM